jgi:hypothetical protein
MRPLDLPESARPEELKRDHTGQEIRDAVVLRQAQVCENTIRLGETRIHAGVILKYPAC